MRRRSGERGLKLLVITEWNQRPFALLTGEAVAPKFES